MSRQAYPLPGARPWVGTDAVAHHRAGRSDQWIAVHYGLRISDARTRLNNLLMAAPPTTRANRRCLGVDCGKVFLSDGPGNRRCPQCAKRGGDSPFEPAHV